MKLGKHITALAALTTTLMMGASGAWAQSTLDIIKERGQLRCQVGPTIPRLLQSGF